MSRCVINARRITSMTPSIRSRPIWHAAGFVSGEPAAARLEKLEAMIARSGLDGEDIAPFLAALLSISAEGRYPSLEMAPANRRSGRSRL